MAKRRHPAALFEVLYKPVVQERPRPGWFSQAQKIFQRPVQRVVASKPEITPRHQVAPHTPAVDLAPPPVAISIPTPAPKQMPAPAPAAAPVVHYRGGSDDRSEGISLNVDRTRQEILIRLSFISAGILAAGFLGLLIFSYLFGKQNTVSTRPVLTRETTPDLRSRPAQSGVLNLATARTEVRPEKITSPSTPVATPPQPPTFTVDDPKRQAGLTYVVIQTYVKEEMAKQAREMLIAEGVPCTIERNLPPWGTQWFCVVGTKGFSTTSRSAEYAAYLKRIELISLGHAKKGSYLELHPTALQWGKTR